MSVQDVPKSEIRKDNFQFGAVFLGFCLVAMALFALVMMSFKPNQPKQNELFLESISRDCPAACSGMVPFNAAKP